MLRYAISMLLPLSCYGCIAVLRCREEECDDEDADGVEWNVKLIATRVVPHDDDAAHDDDGDDAAADDDIDDGGDDCGGGTDCNHESSSVCGFGWRLGADGIEHLFKRSSRAFSQHVASVSLSPKPSLSEVLSKLKAHNLVS